MQPLSDVEIFGRHGVSTAKCGRFWLFLVDGSAFRSFFSPALVFVCTPFFSLAEAHASSFEGQFTETVNGECVGSTIAKRGAEIPNTGFDRNLKPRGKVFKFSINSQSIRAFRGNGSGWVLNKSVSTRTASRNPMSRKYLSRPNVQMSHEFIYKINDRGAIRVELVPGTFEAKVATDGSRLSGLSFTVDQRVLVGEFSKEGHELILRSEKPSIETVTYSNGNVVQRICEWTHRILLNR